MYMVLADVFIQFDWLFLDYPRQTHQMDVHVQTA